MPDMEKLRSAAKEAVLRDDVKYLIGWKKGTYGLRAAPHFVSKPEETDELIFSPLCCNNLATYLAIAEKLPVPRGQEADTRKIALMVKGCDSRAVVQQIVEQGIKRENVVIIGCPCRGVIDLAKAEEKLSTGAEQIDARWDGDKIVFCLPDGEKTLPREDVLADKCLTCRYPNPVLSDVLLWEEEKAGSDEYTDVDELESKDPEERWAFWEAKFSTCVRCYSCRNVCPMCYCDDCILERLNPTWVNRANNISENTVFHLARAFHLAGRCVECGECARVCPVNIPIMKLNRKLTRDVRDKYSFEPGTDIDSKPLQASYRPNDQENFIL